ncbi:helix-turn-helix domain-containing protein [Methanoregula sp.]|uniref:winged helix-turn-helix transcriptional regulator n=1 Tax=Methanoregula sp. TaxID=2052170 RepID=UPI00260C9F19|nr:helix-turn-helix domain-containing protein [Methanoregula sp.]MDD5143617.1 helix-turn-helix domain-containing protein [Methanoregula sp.]
MEEESDPLCICCLRGIMPTIAKKWAICIIVELGRRPSMRFSEMMKDCGKISPKSLADVLKELQNAELIERVCYAEVPPRVEYRLTEHGRSLRVAIGPLLHWAKEYNLLFLSYRIPMLAKVPDP